MDKDLLFALFYKTDKGDKFIGIYDDPEIAYEFIDEVCPIDPELDDEDTSDYYLLSSPLNPED